MSATWFLTMIEFCRQNARWIALGMALSFLATLVPFWF